MDEIWNLTEDITDDKVGEDNFCDGHAVQLLQRQEWNDNDNYLPLNFIEVDYSSKLRSFLGMKMKIMNYYDGINI